MIEYSYLILTQQNTQINLVIIIFHYITVMNKQILLISLLIILINTQPYQLDSVTPLSTAINVITNYIWNFTISNQIPTNIQLNFSNNVIVSTSSQVFYSGTLLSSNFVNSSIISFNYPATTNGTISILVTNVQNPPQSIVVYMNAIIDSVSTSYQMPVFSGGVLQRCDWKFTGTTQMKNQNLSIHIQISNPIPVGNRTLRISPTNYVNANYQIINTSQILICTFSLDNSTYSNANYCQYNLNEIQMGIILTSVLSSGSHIFIMIQPVNNPPTVTINSSLYSVYTYGNEGIIDNPPSNGCTIQYIPATTYNGVFTQNQVVNSIYYSPVIKVSEAVFPEIQVGDTLTLWHFANLSCPSSSSSLKLMRNNLITIFWPMNNSDYERTYITNNSDSSNAPLQIRFDCNIIIPFQTYPTNVTLRFSRNSALYMFIDTKLIPQPAFLPQQNVKLSVANTQMLALTVYIFEILISHPLSANAQIDIDLPSSVDTNSFSNDYNLIVNSVTVIAFQCTIDPIVNIIHFNLNASSQIIANSVLILTINGLMNPKAPTLVVFGITTFYQYYNDASKVQQNSAAVNFTPTVRTVTASIVPTNFSVFEYATFSITYHNELNVPANSTFSLSFPSQLSNITFNNVTVNSALQNMIQYVSSNRVNLTYTSTIIQNSIFLFSFNARMPPQMKNLPSITILLTSSNGTQYETVKEGLSISVAYTAIASYTITPEVLTTGSTSAYHIKFITVVPHQDPFYIQVTVPSNIILTQTPITCSSICQPSAVIINATTFSIKIVNQSSNNQTNIFSFTLSNFTNLRSVSTSGWIFRSFSSNYSQITYANATYSITMPNALVGKLSLEDQYYRNNTNLVKLDIKFFNSLISTDYLRIEVPSNVYTLEGTISCFMSTCSVDITSTPQLLIIKVTNFITNIINNELSLYISGLRSSTTTRYQEYYNIIITTLTAESFIIDEGIVKYNISCNGDAIQTNNCKQCFTNGTCISCYFDDILQSFYYNGICTSNCSSISQYTYYSNNNFCMPCIYPCQTCLNETACITCLNVTTLYWFNNYTCSIVCPVTNGYFIKTYTLNGRVFYQCASCSDINCLVCSNQTQNSCLVCTNGTVIYQGQCSNSCPINHYISNNLCISCDSSCNECIGSSSKNCITCAPSYLNYSGQCISSCPSGTVLLNGITCGCQSVCLICQTIASNCLSCASSSQFVYNGQCLSICPMSTYVFGNKCISCSQGCLVCTSNTCLQCISGYFLHENQCFSDCNSISQQYDVDQTGLKCVLCPSGCNTCNGKTCTNCLTNYTLQQNSCVLTCSLTDSCNNKDNKDNANKNANSIFLVPGTISIVLWIAIATILKFVIWKSYLPYTYITIGGIIELVLSLSLAINLGQSSSSSARLLLESSTFYRSVVYTFLIVNLVWNYFSNFIYVVLFCKYIKALIPDKTLDILSNSFVVIIGTVLNYRFCLIAFSKLLDSPQIPITNQSRLNPIHYLCIATAIISIIPIIAAVLLICNQQPLTDIFMLSIDYLIVSIINVLFTIWMVATSKTDSYYSNKNVNYSTQEINRTQEGINQQQQHGISKNEKQNSKTNLNDIEFVDCENSIQFEKEEYYNQLIDNGQNHNIEHNEVIPQKIYVNSTKYAAPIKLQTNIDNIDDLQLVQSIDNQMTKQSKTNNEKNKSIIDDKTKAVNKEKVMQNSKSPTKNSKIPEQNHRSIHSNTDIKIKEAKKRYEKAANERLSINKTVTKEIKQNQTKTHRYKGINQISINEIQPSHLNTQERNFNIAEFNENE